MSRFVETDIQKYLYTNPAIDAEEFGETCMSSTDLFHNGPHMNWTLATATRRDPISLTVNSCISKPLRPSIHWFHVGLTHTHSFARTHPRTFARVSNCQEPKPRHCKEPNPNHANMKVYLGPDTCRALVLAIAAYTHTGTLPTFS